MKATFRLNVKTLIIFILILLIACGVAAFLIIDKLINTRVFESVSMYTEQVHVPDQPFNLLDAVTNGKAFIMDYPTDGSFTILWGTDFHLRRGPFSNRNKVYALLDKAFEETKPDLTIITGDLLFSFDGGKILNEFAQFMEDRNQKWAYCFGNHDGEYDYDRKTLGNILADYPHALFSEGEDWVLGFSDYPIVLMEDGVPKQALMLLDSHDSRIYEGGIIGPDYVYPSQIAWYRWVEDSLGSVPLYTFLHIPIPEFRALWEYGKTEGVKMDRTINTPLENSGLFQAMKEKNNTVAIFSGHDHLNDFHGNWDGIDLHYGRSASYGSYGSKDFPKGIKTITLFADQSPYAVQTYTVDQWGL